MINIFMHTIKLRNFDILVNDDKNSIIAIQSGQPVDSLFNKELINIFQNKLKGFLSIFEEMVNIEPGSKILDIGSGNSLFDIALAKRFPELNLNFVLLDGNNFDKAVNTLVANSKVHNIEYQTYNLWEPVFDNISLNGLDQSKFTTADPSDEYWGEPGSFDVIMSTASWGWHYPIETYLEKAYNLLKPGGYLIIRPLLKANNYIETVNELFGLPLYLKSCTFKSLQGKVKLDEEAHWAKFVKPTGPNHIMFYHVIWQKP